MIHQSEVNSFLRGWRGRPEGLMDTRVKSGRVVTETIRSNTRVHRPTEAYIVNIDGRSSLASRFLCGEASHSVLPIDPDAHHFIPCERCEEVAEYGDTDLRVYGYRDDADRFVYIGLTRNLTTRRASHARNSGWFGLATSFEVLSTHPTKSEGLLAEAAAIRLHSPLFNIVHNQKGNAA